MRAALILHTLAARWYYPRTDSGLFTMKRITFLLVVTLALSGFVQYLDTAHAQTSNNALAADQVLALVNEWRIQEGLWPLKPNPMLAAMALAQASYLVGRIDAIPAEREELFHLDADGRKPAERAAAAPYQWPKTGLSVLVGENAAVGSPSFAMRFWKNSSIHKRAALSNRYREAGVAAVPYKTGFIFIMNFGARPDVLPALVDTAGDSIYLSNDCFCAVKAQAQPTFIRLFNSEGVPLTESKPWQPTLGVPTGLRDATLFVLFSNGNNQVITRVQIGTDTVRLPANSVVDGEGATLTSVAAVPLALQPTATPLGATYTPTLTPTPGPTSTPTLTPTTAASASLLLLYNSRALIIYNSSLKLINLDGLSIGNESSRIAMSAWAVVSSFPVGAFPSSHCLQADAGVTESAPANNCRFIRSLISVSPLRAFWLKGSFTVVRDGVTLATCAADPGRCVIALPDGPQYKE